MKYKFNQERNWEIEVVMVNLLTGGLTVRIDPYSISPDVSWKVDYNYDRTVEFFVPMEHIEFVITFMPENDIESEYRVSSYGKFRGNRLWMKLE